MRPVICSAFNPPAKLPMLSIVGCIISCSFASEKYKMAAAFLMKNTLMKMQTKALTRIQSRNFCEAGIPAAMFREKRKLVKI